MGSLALLAREAGYTVTGSDQAIYPPMSTLLVEQGIEVIDGFDLGQLDNGAETPVLLGTPPMRNPGVSPA